MQDIALGDLNSELEGLKAKNEELVNLVENERMQMKEKVQQKNDEIHEITGEYQFKNRALE